MRKPQAKQVLDFLLKNYDGPHQEEWFYFMDILLDIVLEDAKQNGYPRLLKDYPQFYQPKKS